MMGKSTLMVNCLAGKETILVLEKKNLKAGYYWSNMLKDTTKYMN